jgi:hypothetical protein
MYRKTDTTIHGNCASIQPAFNVYKAQLKGKPSAPLERAVNTGLETAYRFYTYLVFVHDFCGDKY